MVSMVVRVLDGNNEGSIVKFSGVAALAVVLLISATAATADSGYALQIGETWKGVKIGDSPPRSRDLICRHQQCYPMADILHPTHLYRKYGISDLKPESLKLITGVEQRGRLLVNLPDDLGWELFIRSRSQYYRDNRDSAKGLHIWIH